MKKVLAILFVLLMLCSCGNKAQQEEIKDEPQNKQEEIIGGNTINPMTEYTSLDEVNNLLHGKLGHPGVMGIDDEKFFIVNSGDLQIGEYDFTINGNKCCMRFCDRATADEDISGIYVDGKPAFPSETKKGDIEYNKLDDTRVARWLNMDGQYSFAYTNAECDEEAFIAIAEELLIVTAADGNGSK